MQIARRTLISVAIVWAMAVPAAAYAASRPHMGGIGRGAALTVYAVGALVCHQRIERSFRLWGVPLPVCARCLGLYFGAGTLAIVIMAIPYARPGSGLAARQVDALPFAVEAARLLPPANSPNETAAARGVLAAAVTPTALSLMYEWTTGDVPSNWTRAAAGAVLCAAIALVLLRAVTNRID